MGLDMKIHELIWSRDRIEHIARHGVTPNEVKEVCLGNSFVQRTKSQGENPVYYFLGQKQMLDVTCFVL